MAKILGGALEGLHRISGGMGAWAPLALLLDLPLFTGLNLVATCTPTLNLGLNDVTDSSLAGSGLRHGVTMRTRWCFRAVTSPASSSIPKGGALDWPGRMGTLKDPQWLKRVNSLIKNL